jgi:hypothetical protein
MEATRHRGALLRAFHFAQRVKEARAWGVDRMDPIAAVFSCSQCSGLHCDVFSGRPPVIPRWNPPPSVPFDHGEGSED